MLLVLSWRNGDVSNHVVSDEPPTLMHVSCNIQNMLLPKPNTLFFIRFSNLCVNPVCIASQTKYLRYENIRQIKRSLCLTHREVGGYLKLRM